jgi:hypothetical protein
MALVGNFFKKGNQLKKMLDERTTETLRPLLLGIDMLFDQEVS